MCWALAAASQSLTCARYKQTPNALLDMISIYPEKEAKIRGKIESELMEYMDFIVLENTLIQVNWGYNKALMSVKVFTNNQVFSFSDAQELNTENEKLVTDSVTYTRIDSSDTFYYYQLTEPNALPLVIQLMDSLPQNNFKQQSWINNNPEIGVLMDFKVFPKQFVFGSPRTFSTLDSLQIIALPDAVTKEELEALTANIKSKKNRQQLLELLALAMPVDKP
jgi:hypothetical protein